MTEPSDKTFARGETLHSACLCCEHAAWRIHDLRQSLIGAVEAARSGRLPPDGWVDAVEKLLSKHDPNRNSSNKGKLTMSEYGYNRVIDTFAKDKTAGSFLLEDDGGDIPGGIQRMAREVDQLRALLKRAHSTIKHGAATSIAHAQILSDIEKAVRLKSEAELLKQAFSNKRTLNGRTDRTERL